MKLLIKHYLVFTLLMLAIGITGCQSPEEIAAQTSTVEAATVEVESATATQEVNQTATQDAQTAFDKATAAAEEAAATEQADATASAEAKATTEAEANATIAVRETAEAQEAAFYAALNELQASPGPLAVENVLAAAQQIPTEFGPTDGELDHDRSDNTVKVDCSDRTVTNFVSTVTFYSPYPRNRGQWDFGFFFRHSRDSHYRIVIEANGPWQLAEWNPDINYFGNVDSGYFDHIERDSAAENDLTLIAIGDTAYLSVNGRYEGEFPLETYANEDGFLCVATGLFGGSEIDGESTEYEDFTVWRVLRSQVND